MPSSDTGLGVRMLKISPRPPTNPTQRRRSSLSEWRPMTQLRRCRTTLDRPSSLGQPKKRYCESCTVEYIRRLQASNMESEEKLKTNIQGHSMQRSKSDLNVNIEGMGRQIGSGLLRERSQVYLTNVPDHSRRELHTPIKKQEVKVAKAVVPRKGQIQLSSMAAAMPFGGDPEKKKSDTSPSPLKSANLIRRKDILDQIKMGNKLLEDSEKQKLEEEEMTKNLGAYTMLDLQSGIFEMTDVKNLKKGTSSGTVLSAAVAERRESKDKPLTLPSINRMKIF